MPISVCDKTAVTAYHDKGRLEKPDDLLSSGVLDLGKEAAAGTCDLEVHDGKSCPEDAPD